MEIQSPLFTQPYDFSIPPAIMESEPFVSMIASGTCDYVYLKGRTDIPDTVQCLSQSPVGDWQDALTCTSSVTRVKNNANNDGNTNAWFHGKCKDCGYPVVVIPATVNYLEADYHHYCANKICVHHAGEDMDGEVYPAWVVL